MLRNFIVIIMLGTATTFQAIADCTCNTGFLSASQINSDLDNGTVCAILGGERWQEYHSGGHVYELGDNANGDDVGTWSVVPASAASEAQVVYSYGAGGSGGIYKYKVCKQGNNYDFCGAAFGGRDVTNASVNRNRKGGC